VLTDAGASAESGVPTFRGEEGLWRQFRPEELATEDAFEQNPKLVWEWYIWRRELIRKAQPNAGHYALRTLEQNVDDFTLITQNVDGLHQRAGSESVIEIHGNIMRSRCHSCRASMGVQGLGADGKPVRCSCGGLIRPDVVWFGELLDSQALKRAWDAVRRAEVFFSVGTSSAVQPAAGLADLAKQNGAFLVEVNPEPTEMSDRFDELLRGRAGEILPQICVMSGLNKPGLAKVTA
jgi:NAD-dependent deacetylase